MNQIDNYILKCQQKNDPRFNESLELEDFGTTINMQTIFVCNLNCFFCRGSINNIDEISKTQTMPQSSFEIFIKKITDYGINHIQITPAVGEPLIDKDIKEKILFLENNDKIKYYMLTTNLTQLKSEHIELFKQCKKLYLTVSIYGYDKESYIKNSGRDRFSKFIENFKIIKELFMKKETGSLLELNIRCDRNYDSTFPKTKLFYMIYQMITSDNISINTAEVYNTNRANNLSNFEYVKRKRSGVCPFGPGDGGGILPNGDFLFCPFNDLKKEGVMGNLFKQSLEEIYSSKMWKELIENQTNDKYTGICEKCTETW
jgi:radical SAM protein with 4Fe4S-binding SPASM domain